MTTTYLKSRSGQLKALRMLSIESKLDANTHFALRALQIYQWSHFRQFYCTRDKTSELRRLMEVGVLEHGRDFRVFAVD